ncbi:hypothetical protein [Bartonella phoceensis]|nr:hypothetical protein [Bartonella phoceensis]
MKKSEDFLLKLLSEKICNMIIEGEELQLASSLNVGNKGKFTAEALFL